MAPSLTYHWLIHNCPIVDISFDPPTKSDLQGFFDSNNGFLELLAKSIAPQDGETMQLLRIDVTRKLEEETGDEIADNAKRSSLKTGIPNR